MAAGAGIMRAAAGPEESSPELQAQSAAVIRPTVSARDSGWA